MVMGRRARSRGKSAAPIAATQERSVYKPMSERQIAHLEGENEALKARQAVLRLRENK